MKKENPYITIILPTYNGADRISRAILSVQQQSFQDWELIVIIDGSTDATLERVSRIAQQDDRIVVINNKLNQGIQKTLNHGLRGARGFYIARIDDDDIWIDNRKLQKQYDFLQNNLEYVLVGTGMVLVDETGKEIGKYVFPKNDKDIRKKILGQNCFAHPTVMFRKETISQIGEYSEKKEHTHIEDHELWLRMGTVGKFANLNEYAITYQITPKSISGKNKHAQFYKKISLCVYYRKKYPDFLKNLFKVIFMFIGYMSIGWMFSNSSKIRSKVTEWYKKFL